MLQLALPKTSWWLCFFFLIWWLETYHEAKFNKKNFTHIQNVPDEDIIYSKSLTFGTTDILNQVTIYLMGLSFAW